MDEAVPRADSSRCSPASQKKSEVQPPDENGSARDSRARARLGHKAEDETLRGLLRPRPEAPVVKASVSDRSSPSDRSPRSPFVPRGPSHVPRGRSAVTRRATCRDRACRGWGRGGDGAPAMRPRGLGPLGEPGRLIRSGRLSAAADGAAELAAEEAAEPDQCGAERTAEDRPRSESQAAGHAPSASRPCSRPTTPGPGSCGARVRPGVAADPDHRGASAWEIAAALLLVVGLIPVLLRLSGCLSRNAVLRAGVRCGSSTR